MKTPTTYRCKKDVQFDRYDEDGNYAEEAITVEEGSLFERSNQDYRIIGGEVRLDGIGKDEGRWLEISETTLSIYFEEVNDGDSEDEPENKENS